MKMHKMARVRSKFKLSFVRTVCLPGLLDVSCALENLHGISKPVKSRRKTSLFFPKKLKNFHRATGKLRAFYQPCSQTSHGSARSSLYFQYFLHKNYIQTVLGSPKRQKSALFLVISRFFTQQERERKQNTWIILCIFYDILILTEKHGNQIAKCILPINSKLCFLSESPLSDVTKYGVKFFRRYFLI